MEARQTLKGSAVPKALLIALALCAAVILAVGASLIIRDTSSSGSNATSVHPAAGTVLRQDWEAKASPAQSAAPIKHKSFDQMPGFRD